MLYAGKLEDGTPFDSCNNKEDPFSFRLGAGKVIKGWDLGVASMKKGEKALFVLKPDYAYGSSGSPPKIPPNATLHFEIELLGISEEPPSKWDYTPEQRIEKAFQMKEEGNDLFKKGDYDKAQKKYEESLDYLETEKGEKIKECKISCFLNLSMVYIKKKENIKAVEHASKALEADPKNIKALYRRGLAYSNFSNFDDAKTDFEDALGLDPNNADVKRELANLIQKKKMAIQKDKKIFGKLFEQSYYDTVVVCEYSNASNPIVYFSIQIGEKPAERLEFELFYNLVPKTVDNFRALVIGDRGIGKCGKALAYKGTIFHRLIKGFMLQGGDFEKGDGTGGESIYGGKFDDENFIAKHKKRGFLSMANAGANTNGSQFFITFKETGWLDGKHVVFGCLVNGHEFLNTIENVECDGEKPKENIRVVDCGLVSKDKEEHKN